MPAPSLAWLLELAAELRTWKDPQAAQWSRALAPLEAGAARHLKQWLPDLTYPIRIGEHDQTAFSFGLVWDWAAIAGDFQRWIDRRELPAPTPALVAPPGDPFGMEP